MAVALYSPRPIVGQDFKGVKRVTVPKQSMSLQEIVRRFVRREAVPVSQDGIYETRFGDLEKLATADIYDRLERAEELRDQISAFNKREKDRVEKEAADKKAADEAAFEKRVADGIAAKKGNVQTAQS